MRIWSWLLNKIRGVRTVRITAFGESVELITPPGSTLTASELEAMTIRCAWCGMPIFIGSPITLYCVKAPDVLPEYAVPYSNGEGRPTSYVGCLRWDCAVTGGDRSGFWLPGDDQHGHVHRVPSPLEQLMANPNGCIIVGDLTDIGEAMRPDSKKKN